jgi:endo-1,3-1,4-beta-glycanase ExoK
MRSMQLFGSAVISVLLLHVAPALAKPWKGAELITQQTFRYGAFEARILAARGSGLITPFFLWKNDSEVPGQEWQEQDFEIFGRDGRYQTQLMTPGEDGEQRTEHNTYHSLPSPAWDRYYTYRMEWTPEYLAFYVDGELVRVETDSEEYAKLMDPDQAEAAQLRVSLWAGDTGWSGRFDEDSAPAATFVNWVQTFTYTPGSGPGGSDFSPLWRDDFNGQGAPDSSRWWAANWTFEYAVNDYVAQNGRVQDGALVLVFTDEDSTGLIPSVPADDGSSGGNDGGQTGPSPVDPDAGNGEEGPVSVDPEPTRCEPITYAAQGMSPSAGGLAEDGWNLWSNGSLSETHGFASESSVITVRARGELGGGAWPHLVVTIDGEAVGDAIVESSSFSSYELVQTGAGEHELGVWFDNDYYVDGGEDRNVVIADVTVAPICQ